MTVQSRQEAAEEKNRIAGRTDRANNNMPSLAIIKPNQTNNPFPFLSPEDPRELGSGQGGFSERGQIRFVPQKVSTSRRFLVLELVLFLGAWWRLRYLSPHAQCNHAYMGGASCLLS